MLAGQIKSLLTMKSILTISLFFIVLVSEAQTINKTWKKDLTNDLEQFKACDNSSYSGVNPCNKYIGNSLTTVYQINDFYSSNDKRHMRVNEISDYLKSSTKWTLLGYGYDQKALENAQLYANSNKAVVAIYINEEEIGHLSLITPGELIPSGTWGFRVPNSASFSVSNPQKSYIDKGLSYSFEKQHIKNVLIYGRNY